LNSNRWWQENISIENWFQQSQTWAKLEFCWWRFFGLFKIDQEHSLSRTKRNQVLIQGYWNQACLESENYFKNFSISPLSRRKRSRYGFWQGWFICQIDRTWKEHFFDEFVGWKRKRMISKWAQKDPSLKRHLDKLFSQIKPSQKYDHAPQQHSVSLNRFPTILRRDCCHSVPHFWWGCSTL
jgi:hypothetical protein